MHRTCLVSWSRALDGRFSDPIVGRDFLIAATVAVVVEMFLNVGSIVARLHSRSGSIRLPLGGWSGVIGSVALAAELRSSHGC